MKNSSFLIGAGFAALAHFVGQAGTIHAATATLVLGLGAAWFLSKAALEYVKTNFDLE